MTLPIVSMKSGEVTSESRNLIAICFRMLVVEREGQHTPMRDSHRAELQQVDVTNIHEGY